GILSFLSSVALAIRLFSGLRDLLVDGPVVAVGLGRTVAVGSASGEAQSSQQNANETHEFTC
ncbi:hypothetical protein, partial [Mesorhizobium sp. M7A.T.Ca.US.000.02.2.1]|uniref:hypothetical protein n=1 Tax=Mesorhizobium sp. M7A.T.Ca.US.000.02.2.1 TaxID=2496793 RepID=UPI001AEC7E80